MCGGGSEKVCYVDENTLCWKIRIIRQRENGSRTIANITDATPESALPPAQATVMKIVSHQKLFDNDDSADDSHKVLTHHSFFFRLLAKAVLKFLMQ